MNNKERLIDWLQRSKTCVLWRDVKMAGSLPDPPTFQCCLPRELKEFASSWRFTIFTSACTQTLFFFSFRSFRARSPLRWRSINPPLQAYILSPALDAFEDKIKDLWTSLYTDVVLFLFLFFSKTCNKCPEVFYQARSTDLRK